MVICLPPCEVKAGFTAEGAEIAKNCYDLLRVLGS
jgi:hypothetical protein